MNSPKTIKFFTYCRKSSEDSQRQVASIGDQVTALTQIADREGLTLARSPFTEERSAKDPGRVIFNEMLNRIEKGEASGLLCWDIDRLSRNPIDNGRLQWMLQKSVIQVIKTPGRSYYPEDAGLLMSIEGGRATDYVMRLSKNVKRGLNSKAMRGWRPSGGPIGYINVGTEKGSKTIASDPERFELVRKMWDLFLTGSYSVSKIRDIAINDWGLRTQKHRKIGGNPPSMSHLYNIFKDPFYYGYYPWKDPETGETTMVKGNHQPMITEKEYRRAQILLGKKGKPQPQTHEFAFTGLMRCGECDSSVTAEEKNQVICTNCKHKFSYVTNTTCSKCGTDISDMANPTILKYTYYHCTKKKNRNCTQKNVRLEELESQFIDVLKGITIDQDYLELALDYLQDKQKNSGGEERAVRLSLQSAYDDCQARLVNLSRAFTSPLNSDESLYTTEEFSTQKKALIAERDRLEKEMGGTKEKLDRDLEMAQRVFNFCAFALRHFNTDDLHKKREIFSTIGSNLILKDKKLNIEKLHPYLLIENEMREQMATFSSLEPKKGRSTKGKEAAFATSSPDLLRDQDSNLEPTP